MKKSPQALFVVLLVLTIVSHSHAGMAWASEDDQTEVKTETSRRTFIETKFLQLKENLLQKKAQRQERHEEREDNRAENQELKKEARKETQENRQEEREEKRAEKMDSMADRVEKRFGMHEQKLSNWLEKAEKHLSELKAKGKDTTAAEKSLAKAKTALADAVALGKVSVTQLRSIEPADWQTQKPAVKAARESVQKAQAAFIAALKEIRQVLAELKKLNS